MKGQTLIEVLVALGIAVVVMTAIATAMLTSLNNSHYSKLQNQATQYAQQGMEIVQNYRDAFSLSPTSATSKLKNDGETCIPASCSPAKNFINCFGALTAPECLPLESSLKRSVTLIHNDSDINKCNGSTRAIVKVKWNDGKCSGTTDCHEVNLTSCMSDSYRSGL